jgi:hypothetical protein|tara:strand:- start:587 stop:826 length:240 start_codon:yes stop_codon:yes gene_type:complete
VLLGPAALPLALVLVLEPVLLPQLEPRPKSRRERPMTTTKSTRLLHAPPAHRAAESVSVAFGCGRISQAACSALEVCGQ